EEADDRLSGEVEREVFGTDRLDGRAGLDGGVERENQAGQEQEAEADAKRLRPEPLPDLFDQDRTGRVGNALFQRHPVHHGAPLSCGLPRRASISCAKSTRTRAMPQSPITCGTASLLWAPRFTSPMTGFRKFKIVPPGSRPTSAAASGGPPAPTTTRPS